MLREGTLVDATLIAAPPSTKNARKQRDPEMHQTQKGNPWYFGLKAPIGADRDRKRMYSRVETVANVVTLPKLRNCGPGKRRKCIPTPVTLAWRNDRR